MSATEPAMTLSELAAYLSVSPQPMYDRRSQGRGPRGFRVGRQLRFSTAEIEGTGEIEAWLARMEAADGERHAPRGRA
jgi:predicted DNA-binding transcriptional regulator AlpA